MSDDSFEFPTDTADDTRSINEFTTPFQLFDETIDIEILERAWRTFESTQQQVLLEGNKKAWMVCAFYTSVWQGTPIGQQPPYLFSLSDLLKKWDLSVLEFFDKLNKWIEMINGNRRMQEHVSRVQTTLAVSTVIYKKFLPIFRSMFQNRRRDPRDGENELQAVNLFQFIWVTFLALKKLLPTGLEDLLNSFHILLCVIDLVAEELQQVQSPLLNPEFIQLMDSSGSKSTLDFLCQQFDGVELDAKHMLLHWVMPKIRHYQANKILTAKNPHKPEEIYMLASWMNNLLELNRHYEEHIMQRLEVDERMFISHLSEDVSTVFNDQFDDSAITILKRGNLESSWAVDADLLLRVSTQRCLEKVQLTVKPLNTPLTARSYVISSEQFCPATPISAAAQRTQKLHELFANEDEESEFTMLISQCPSQTWKNVIDHLELLDGRIKRKVELEQFQLPDYDAAIGCQLEQRLSNVKMLFHRLLQKTVMHDRQRNTRGDIAELNHILNKEEFLDGLYICALEIVLMTYNSEREFPWSVQTLLLKPIRFYKVIEIVVRSEPELSREMVKHLNRCEERVLEELAWAKDSPLWNSLEQNELGVPPCAAVTYMEIGGVLTGPTRPTANMPTTISVRYPPSPMKPLDRMPMKRRSEYLDEQGEAYNNVQNEHFGMPSSISLFFRKVYYLAAVRLHDLCDRLRLEEAARNRIWTLFEEILRSKTEFFMRGRHIDQNLMCCIYITSKISNIDLSFHKIMHHYRHQPQSSSRIYRQVRVDNSNAAQPTPNVDDGASRDSVGSFSGQGSGRKLRSGSTVPQPGQASAPLTPEPQADFIDLIKYYNRVFVPQVEDFVKKLHPTNSDSKENIVSIIQMPKIPCSTLSPRRMIGDQLSIVPMSAVTHVPRRGGAASIHGGITVKPEPSNVGSATVIRRQRMF